MPNSSWARAGPFQVSIDFSPEGSDRRRAFYFFKKKNFWTFFLRVRLALSPLSIRLCLSLIFFIDLQGQPTSFPSSLGLQIGLPFHPRQTLEAPLPTNDIPFSPSIIPFSFSLSTTNHQIRRPALPCVPDLISSSFLTHSPLCPRLLFLLPDRTQ